MAAQQISPSVHRAKGRMTQAKRAEAAHSHTWQRPVHLSFLPLRPRSREQAVSDVRRGGTGLSPLRKSPLSFLFLGLVTAPAWNEVVAVTTALFSSRGDEWCRRSAVTTDGAHAASLHRPIPSPSPFLHLAAPLQDGLRQRKSGPRSGAASPSRPSRVASAPKAQAESRPHGGEAWHMP